jgi:hypothetical protein
MSEPLIYLSTYRVKEGKREQLEKYFEKVFDIVERNEPQIIAFHAFLNEVGTELTSIQIHPDTASLDFHMQVLRENWDESFSEYADLFELDGVRIEYYGTPPASALEMDIQGGVDPILKPHHVAGFTRAMAVE